MSDKEGYFPPNTPQSVIDDTLYTDHGNMHIDDWTALESDLNAIEQKEGKDDN